MIVEHYKKADLFLFSSTTDTQGLVLAEAMAAGTPVISVDGPGQRDIIVQGNNGFIIENIDDMVHKITAIADDPTLHEQLQHGAFKTAQRYRPEHIVQQVLSVYQKLV